MSLTIDLPASKIIEAEVLVQELRDDRRCAPRKSPDVAAQLRLMGVTESQACDVADISEGGLFVFVPLAYGLNVGQRCEVQLSARNPAARCPTDDICYATVVRTEMVSDDSGRFLGAGLRFDQPLFL
jgi:hypothetical protein